jgi:hypothetical protein
MKLSAQKIKTTAFVGVELERADRHTERQIDR